MSFSKLRQLGESRRESPGPLPTLRGASLPVCAALLFLTACNNTTETTAPTTAAPAQSAQTGDFSRGLIGKPAQPFTLNDADGKPVDIAPLLGTKPIVLIVYRGNW